MNARTALLVALAALALAACGNKGPLVQAPVDIPVEPPLDDAPLDQGPLDQGPLDAAPVAPPVEVPVDPPEDDGGDE